MSLDRCKNLFEPMVLTFFVSLFSFQFAGATTGGAPLSAMMNKSLVNIAFQRTACSGVLIGPRTVLTAGHCKRMGGAPSKVGNFSDGHKSECAVQKVVNFATLDPSAYSNKTLEFQPDLLLLHLEAPLCNSKPAILQTQSLSPLDSVFLAGHGLWEYGYGVGTQIEAKVISSQEVRSHVSAPEGMDREIRKIEDFLANKALEYIPAIPVSTEQSICPGDSGGPVFAESDGEMLLFGVNAVVVGNDKLGASECGYGYVQFISPIAPYMDWIEETIQGWQ